MKRSASKASDTVPAPTTNDEPGAALRANVVTYSEYDERVYVNGAPHLKFASIGRIYEALVARAVGHLAKDPGSITVLELGAGSGLATIPWFKRGIRVTAVDSSAPMLALFAARASEYGVRPTTIVDDALSYLHATDSTFDVATHVSMLHHVPDYLGLLSRSASHIRPGGCLITFQDPLRYDRVPFGHHFADRVSYFAWRSAQGNVRRGLKTRWRRLRGVYAATEAVDFDEYHVVRNGVDSSEVARLLRSLFDTVEVVPYWSTYSRALQWAGERLHLVSSFGVLALGRQPN